MTDEEKGIAEVEAALNGGWVVNDENTIFGACVLCRSEESKRKIMNS